MNRNILLIAADDLCHLDRMLAVLVRGFDLPNLRRLMDSGTDFDRAYCVVPLCEPARTAVMSGQSPADTRSFDLTIGWKQILRPENLWTYQLRRAGYYMGTVGKVFHGYKPQPDWVYAALYDNKPFRFPSWQPSGPGTEYGGLQGRGWDNETDWYDYHVASRTIHHLRRFRQDRPWYWEAGFYRPHMPFWAPNRCFDAVPLDRVMLPEDWQGGFQGSPFADSYIRGGINPSSDPATWTDEEIQHARMTIRNYAAGALFMDDQLGRILDALAASRFADNTVVAFYSDHGYHLSDHNAWHKFTLYEQAACAPFVIRLPGQTPRRVSAPVSHIDLGPTLLELAGVPDTMTGRGTSLVPWITGQTPPERAIPTFWYGSVSCAIGGQRVTVYQDGSAEMFDIARDPWATTDIAASDPGFPALRDIALQTCADWGFLLVDDRPAEGATGQLVSYLGDVRTPRLTTSFVALGDVVPAPGRAPGHQRMYGAPTEADQVIHLPAHINEFGTMGRRAADMTLVGNDLGNRVRVEESHNAHFRAHLGDGDNELMSPGRVKVTAHGGAGNDTLRGGMIAGGRLYGGPGDDVLLGGAASVRLYGGAGNDLLIGGQRGDTLVGGPGDDTLQGNAGDNLLILDAGRNHATGGPGRNTFRVHRTAERNVIADLKPGDVLDLTDWAGIGPVRVDAQGSAVIVAAAHERLVCENTDPATVRSAILGADLSP